MCSGSSKSSTLRRGSPADGRNDAGYRHRCCSTSCFDDPEIPVGLKGLIGRLQIPMLKVAIADKSFFARKTHPARPAARYVRRSRRAPAGRVQRRQHDASCTWRRSSSTSWNTFEDDVGVLRGARREQVHRSSPEHDKQVEADARGAARANRADREPVRCKDRGPGRSESAGRGPRRFQAVFEFLVKQWVKYLLASCTKSGRDEREEWKNAIEAMDQVVWSVEPDRHALRSAQARGHRAGLVRRLRRRNAK